MSKTFSVILDKKKDCIVSIGAKGNFQDFLRIYKDNEGYHLHFWSEGSPIIYYTTQLENPQQYDLTWAKISILVTQESIGKLKLETKKLENKKKRKKGKRKGKNTRKIMIQKKSL